MQNLKWLLGAPKGTGKAQNILRFLLYVYESEMQIENHMVHTDI